MDTLEKCEKNSAVFQESSAEDGQDMVKKLQDVNERLYTSMKAFQIAAQESGSLVFTYDTARQTIFVDERTARAFGVTAIQEGVPYEMVRRGVVSEDTREEYIRLHEAMIKGAEAAEGIVKLIQADGSSSVHELKFTAILDEDGKNTGMAVGVYRDITKRYLRDQELERYQQTMYAAEHYAFRYRAVEDLLTVYVFSASGKEGEKSFFYEKFMAHVSAGEICPENDIKILREVFDKGAREPVQVQLYSQKTKKLRWYGITAAVSGEDREKDGTWLPEEGVGAAREITGTITDLTGYKEKEEAYCKLEHVFQGMGKEYLGIYEIDLNNDSYEVLAYSGELLQKLPQKSCYSQAVEKIAEEIIAPEYRKAFRQYSSPVYLKNILLKERRIEVEFMTAGQKQIWQRVVFLVSEYQNDIPSKAVLYQADISRIKSESLRQQQAMVEAYRLAEASNAAKTEFFSRMSHDIRTPMNAIIGMTAIAGANLDNPVRVKECLNKINTASKHLLSLINEVLDMSKIESGTVQLQNEEFNLADLLDDMVTMALPQIKEKGHGFHMDVGSIRHENVVGDSLRLQQIFANLISNAVKYTPMGGKISVSVRERPSTVTGYGEYEFKFQDSGIGMSQEFQKILFEPFTREEDSRVSQVQGTGLGMTIARNLIHLMDGEIQVESRQNQGSCFTVTVQLKLVGNETQCIEELKELPVLVVDDDASACESTCMILEDIGMLGEFCLSGREAVEKVLAAKRGSRDYFAVILDWKMPDMDGISTAREIRRQVGEEVPIIFLTAYDWSEIEEEARAAGVNHFLTKPLFKSRLVDSFREIIHADREQEAGEGRDGGQESPRKEKKFEGKRLLLAEDNELNAEIAIELIEMTGVSVDWAKDGREAVAMFEGSAEGYYDIVFMDIQMPVMDGYKATAAMRSLHREDAKTIPILAMTANAFMEDAVHARSAGMNEHISKPVDFSRIRAALEKYLNQS